MIGTSERLWMGMLQSALGLGLALLALYTAGLGTISEFLHRGIVLWAAGVLIVLMEPLADNKRGALAWLCWMIDTVLMAIFSLSLFWFFYLSELLWSGLYILSTTDIALAACGLAALIELTRRAVGLPLALLAALALAYALFGDSLPGGLRHAGYSMSTVIQTIWYSLDGVFGLAAAVMVTLVFVYIVFGAVMEGTGASEAMLRIAIQATRRLRGGPAHSAVAASGLFGMVSGSVTANVVGTGVFTMKMMTRRGFPPAFAGGVEASASSAGQFLPPVMGAAAFLMSELVGISYLTICLAALLPALLFFGSLFCAVAIEAAKRRMQPEEPSDANRLTFRDWLAAPLFIFPIVAILIALLAGRSPAMAGFLAVLTAVITALLLNAEVRRRPHRLIRALARGGQAGARIMVAVGAIGVLIGVVNLTGAGLRLADLIVTFGGGTLMGSLLVTMIASLVLGMGLPTLPAYLIIVILVGPVLESLGAPLLAAHLFVMYFGVFSAITPPVALAAFAAAPMVNESPLKIGVAAMRLSIAGFVIPFVFVFQPELLIIFADSPWQVVSVCLRTAISIWFLTTAFARFERGPLGWPQVATRLIASGLCLVSIPALQATGVVLGATAVYSSWRAKMENL